MVFFFTVLSIRYIYRTYNDKGKCTPIGGAHKSSSLRTHNLQKPSRLYWDITPKLAEIIENAVRFAQKVTDFTVLCGDNFYLHVGPWLCTGLHI